MFTYLKLTYIEQDFSVAQTSTKKQWNTTLSCTNKYFSVVTCCFSHRNFILMLLFSVECLRIELYRHKNAPSNRIVTSTNWCKKIELRSAKLQEHNSGANNNDRALIKCNLCSFISYATFLSCRMSKKEEKNRQHCVFCVCVKSYHVWFGNRMKKKKEISTNIRNAEYCCHYFTFSRFLWPNQTFILDHIWTIKLNIRWMYIVLFKAKRIDNFSFLPSMKIKQENPFP